MVAVVVNLNTGVVAAVILILGVVMTEVEAVDSNFNGFAVVVNVIILEDCFRSISDLSLTALSLSLFLTFLLLTLL